MNIHFIAIGGSVMHHLAIALKLKGYNVTGSDDEIYEPAVSNLRQHELLPTEEGWFPSRITSDLDAIILGMHARADNPELQKARQLNLKIYSYPEYIYEQSQNKTRVVIGGSHGKTTITSMIMYVLKAAGKDFDYLVGAHIQGFERMVRITQDAPVIVLEGDEYLASALIREPKFLFYKPHIALLSGIAWDHINAFPTFEGYKNEFSKFIRTIPRDGILFYSGEDEILKEIVETDHSDIKKIPYFTPDYTIEEGITKLRLGDIQVPLKIFGKHNLINLRGAQLICEQLGIQPSDFFEYIKGFRGAAKRLEKLAESRDSVVFKDFAHSPSKVKATIQAVKEQFPGRKLTAVVELHTYSSLNKEFIAEYSGTMDLADEKLIFLNKHALEMKRMHLEKKDVLEAFQTEGLRIFEENNELEQYLRAQMWKNNNLLLMSSGTFNNMDLNEIANFVTHSA